MVFIFKASLPTGKTVKLFGSLQEAVRAGVDPEWERVEVMKFRHP
jgi:hypothetical protein